MVEAAVRGREPLEHLHAALGLGPERDVAGEQVAELPGERGRVEPVLGAAPLAERGAPTGEDGDEPVPASRGRSARRRTVDSAPR